MGKHRTGLRFGAGFDPFGQPLDEFDRLWFLRRDPDDDDDNGGGDDDDDADDDDGDGDGDGDGDEVDEDELPDKVKKILAKERKAAREAKRAQKRAEREARQLREQLKRKKPEQKPKDEKNDDDVEEARRDAERERANRLILTAEVKALAAGKLADPALAPRLLDLDEFDVDDDGNVDADAINEALDELLESTPALAKPKRRGGDGGGGPRGRSRRVTGAEAGRAEAQRRFGDKAGTKK